MPDRIHTGRVIVHVRGRVSAADHVYAHDRVAQLGRLVPGERFQGTVSIVADGPPVCSVVAFADVDIDGVAAHARSESPTISGAVDLLHDRLVRCIEALAPTSRGASSAGAQSSRLLP